MKAVSRFLLLALYLCAACSRLSTTPALPAGGDSLATNAVQKPVTKTDSCSTQSPGPASHQHLARLGAYYFDGWSGPLSNFHFNGLLSGPFSGREPTTGWQDNTPCIVSQQLAFARAAGIDFFVFDWYFKATIREPSDNLNEALEFTRSLPDKHGMQYAILYVDSTSFPAGPADWTSIIARWLRYMKDPAYVRVNGKPLLIIYDISEMITEFRSLASVSRALHYLNAAAQKNGLGGVYVVGGFGVYNGSAGKDSRFPVSGLNPSDGFDALTMYNFPFAPKLFNGVKSYTTLCRAGRWIWIQSAKKQPLPSIPVAMTGWDARPWNEREEPSGDLMSYHRTPSQVAACIRETIDLAASHSRLRVEPPPTPPMVMLEAWNELGEGSYILPTVGSGATYTDALAAMLQAGRLR